MNSKGISLFCTNTKKLICSTASEIQKACHTTKGVTKWLCYLIARNKNISSDIYANLSTFLSFIKASLFFCDSKGKSEYLYAIMPITRTLP